MASPEWRPLHPPKAGQCIIHGHSRRTKKDMAEPGSTMQMQAVQYAKYGGGASALKHVKLAIPAPKKDQILVKIEAASINPVDWKIQTGMLRPALPSKFPYTPGTDIAGEVIKCGPDASGFNAGDRVVSWLPIWSGGAFAEYAVASLKYAAKLPSEVSSLDAAALPVAALTALQSLRDSGGVKFDGNYNGNILVTAASGGVGTYAVQLAKLGGAHVTATCGSRNIELVKSLGADEVLDYKTPEGAALKSPSGCKFDAVIHCTTGIPWSTFQPVLAPKGKVIDLTPNFGGMVRGATNFLTFSKQKLVPFVMAANQKDLEFLVNLIKEKKLKTVADSKFSLAEAAQAWSKCMEGHATGKVLVVVD